MIELVVFDLGRVLVRLCGSWVDACDIAGVARPAKDWPLRDEDTRRELDALCGLLDTAEIDFDTFARDAAPLCGLTADALIKLQQNYLRGPCPGAAELIDELHAAGVKTACLSNTYDLHWKQVLDPSDPNYFPLDKLTWQFASYQLRLRKPDDAIYDHVERTTRVPPERIVFFDDLEANIIPARRRGWNAYLIRTDSDPIAQARTHLRAHGVLR